MGVKWYYVGGWVVFIFKFKSGFGFEDGGGVEIKGDFLGLRVGLFYLLTYF